VGDTGGACRLDGIFHPAICSSKRKYGEKRNTKIHLADCKIHKKKIKMERKEIRRTVLQVLRYNFKRKDGTKRNLQNHLADDGVILKMQFVKFFFRMIMMIHYRSESILHEYTTWLSSSQKYLYQI